ncbi:MAG: hypothetical protein IKY90_04235 [Oscillospiraceae bacterium]|nr:hypothetical protein [Oscillospiraceae bacterium]
MLALLPVLFLSYASLVVKRILKTDGVTAYFILLTGSLNVIYFAALVDFLRPSTMLIYGVLFAVLIIGSVNNIQKKRIHFLTGKVMFFCI